MKAANRDLLVLAKNAPIDQSEMEHVVEKLNQLLFDAECMENICSVNEIIDINNYRIIRKPKKIEKIINRTTLKPFQFIHNKN